MTSQNDAEINEDLHRNISDKSPERMLRCYRFSWTLSAAVSLLSARYLLVESNFHYPLLLYLAQLAAVTIVATIYHQWPRRRQDVGTGRSARRRTRRGFLMVVGAMCFAALSMAFMLQAILHNKNLPTLLMLTSITIFTDEFLCFLFNYTYRSRGELPRIGLLFLACIGMLVAEYRLSVPSLISSIPALLFLGIARSLEKIATQHHLKDMPSQKEQLYWFIGAGYIIGVAWILLFWPDNTFTTTAFGYIPMLTIAINVLATTLALLIEKSIISPIGRSLSNKGAEDDIDFFCVHDRYPLLVLAGIAGCYSVLSARRSYTSWYQYCGFALAVLCADRRSTLGFKLMRLSRQRDHFVVYERLWDLSSTSVGEEDAIRRTESSRIVRQIRSRTKGGLPNLRSIISIVVLFLIWVLYMTLNFSTLEYVRRNPTLDHHYEPNTPLEVVISMYKESVEDVHKFISHLKMQSKTSGASITIYTKDQEADIRDLLVGTGADRIIKLPNIGRECETYLNHINNQWNNLAKHTMFLQADVHYSMQGLYTRLRNYFESDRTGFLNLGWSEVCNCEECGDEFFWSDNIGIIPMYHYQIYNSTNCNNVLLSYKGQFIVSAARVRGISKTIYKDLWQAFVDENSWAHQPEFLHGRPDSMSAPDFGFTVERMWTLLFQCSEMDVAWKCPSLMSGWRLGGDVADCQCFDLRESI